MAAHKKYTNQYTKKHTIHSIKENYKLGLQFIHCYEKIAVSTKCRHKPRFSSATPEHRLRMEYFDNRSYRGRVFTGQMTQPTVSEH